MKRNHPIICWRDPETDLVHTLDEGDKANPRWVRVGRLHENCGVVQDDPN